MERIPEFIANHPLLIGAFVLTVTILIVGEVFRRRNGPQQLSSDAAVRLINDDAVVVDIRESGEFKKAHLVGARNIPRDKLKQRSNQLKSEGKQILLYCANGMTSPTVAKQLMDDGISNISVLRGGLANWRADGLPVATK